MVPEENPTPAPGSATAGELPRLVVLALMSGTSADGVDAVAARLQHLGDRLSWKVLARRSIAYGKELRSRLLQTLKPETSDVVTITQLHTEVGQLYAELAGQITSELADSDPVQLIALSGQTVYHIPGQDASRGWRLPSTLQLGEAAFVAERCNVPVMSDFRQSDMAAGGQGAPMVSFGDLYLYGKKGVNRAIHNLGGISNLTYLNAALDPDAVFAFDTGPANCLMDEACKRYTGEEFDEDGRLAASGRIDEGLLEEWLDLPYFRRPPPKTTGRELFELSAFLPKDASTRRAEDMLATLCAFTAESIAAAYRDFVYSHGLDEILLAGGGALNPTLVEMIRERLSVPVRTFAEVGYDPRDREALAFAVMAYMGANGLPNTLPRATGARRAVVAGKITDSRSRPRG